MSAGSNLDAQEVLAPTLNAATEHKVLEPDPPPFQHLFYAFFFFFSPSFGPFPGFSKTPFEVQPNRALESAGRVEGGQEGFGGSWLRSWCEAVITPRQSDAQGWWIRFCFLGGFGTRRPGAEDPRGGSCDLLGSSFISTAKR